MAKARLFLGYFIKVSRDRRDALTLHDSSLIAMRPTVSVYMTLPNGGVEPTS
jgi:hypothetical protein